MNSALEAAMSIGPIAFIGALLSVPAYYLAYRYAPEPKKRLSGWRYVLAALLVGLAAYVAGTFLGIAIACSPADAGKLCGLVGMFGAGTLLSAAAIFLYARSWARNARRVP